MSLVALTGSLFRLAKCGPDHYWRQLENRKSTNFVPPKKERINPKFFSSKIFAVPAKLVRAQTNTNTSMSSCRHGDINNSVKKKEGSLVQKIQWNVSDTFLFFLYVALFRARTLCLRRYRPSGAIPHRDATQNAREQSRWRSFEGQHLSRFRLSRALVKTHGTATHARDSKKDSRMGTKG